MLSAAPWSGTLLVGGLGYPYDELVAAVLSRLGPAQALGALDCEAMELGRARLPRGQCAPLLASTGALLRKLRSDADSPVTFLAAASCGPCRYAPFASTFRQLLSDHGKGELRVLDQSWAGWISAFGAACAEDLLDALLAGDALLEARRRVHPHVQSSSELRARWSAAADGVIAAVRSGVAPLGALAAQAHWHRELALRPRAALARVVLVGDPWSLHVDGDAQAQLTQQLCEAGVEVEAPPFALWLAYRLWEQAEQGGMSQASASHSSTAALPTAASLAARHALACSAFGMPAVDVPDIAELADWAAPYLPASWRGGYGHVEVGLAARARFEHRAHAVISVKSFGCIPSSGVSDGIVPGVLAEQLGFLAIEVSESAAATRESRLMLHVAAAQARALDEVADSCNKLEMSIAQASARLVPHSPLAAAHASGPRRYACTLACEIAALADAPRTPSLQPELGTCP